MEKKTVIRLTEADLHNIVKSAVKKVLRESASFDTDIEQQVSTANEIMKHSEASVYDAVSTCFPDFRKFNMEQRDHMYEMLMPSGDFQPIGEVANGVLLFSLRLQKFMFMPVSSMELPSIGNRV